MNTFYGDSKNSNRDDDIKKIYDDYLKIQKNIYDERTIKTEEQEIKLSSYATIMTQADNAINKYEELIKKHQNSNFSKFYSDRNDYTKVRISEKIKDDPIAAYATSNSTFQSDFKNNVDYLHSSEGEYLFNTLKLINYNGTYNSDFRKKFGNKFDFIFVAYGIINIYNNTIKDNVDNEYYILKSTREEIEKIIQEELKKKAQIPPPPAYKPPPHPSKNNNRPPKPNFNPPTPSIEELLKQMPNPPKSN